MKDVTEHVCKHQRMNTKDEKPTYLVDCWGDHAGRSEYVFKFIVEGEFHSLLCLLFYVYFAGPPAF